jgi:hypothetical protein
LAENYGFLSGATIEVRENIDDEPPRSHFCDFSGRKTLKKPQKV